MLIVRTIPILVVFFMARYLPRDTQKVEGKEWRTSWWECGKRKGRKEFGRNNPSWTSATFGLCPMCVMLGGLRGNVNARTCK